MDETFFSFFKWKEMHESSSQVARVLTADGEPPFLFFFEKTPFLLYEQSRMRIVVGDVREALTKCKTGFSFL